VGIAIEGANCNDFKMACETIESIPIKRPRPTGHAPQNMCMDKGYDYPEVPVLVRGLGFTPHIRPRGEEVQNVKREPGDKPHRWVVERTHSWMNRFRRILVRWEKKAKTYLAMLHLACGIVAWRAAGLLG
jgi:hypothetical protein